jgi:hypothetical protein
MKDEEVISAIEGATYKLMNARSGRTHEAFRRSQAQKIDEALKIVFKWKNEARAYQELKDTLWAAVWEKIQDRIEFEFQLHNVSHSPKVQK